ncbi:arf-GAP domain and FG repeat-containing protein 1 isoform X8 [Balaenoptera acutorostrata]|uniref:Arf-GAP domain and FG repeat-containing protein 1 isoform X8 n=1 Tax=Balaenoptera acutorostrata TaxID=9767 RepID=A0ABM3TYY0_BALAC|nr:arf-GAP domain and FG repeat-containing protein 1 isoform X8 [Balaenoptera acutorostrata]
MAASAKRKQEEKHLKMLRDMTGLPHNRKCFDCDQRGPTYVNMTVGSFVCTSCSGSLRGLNPPHRVKSISMTTFTQQEIEFLQKHGNEALRKQIVANRREGSCHVKFTFRSEIKVCKQIWLGLFDDRSSAIPDFRDPQKVKEFLQEKYEKKRWYVPPEQAKVVASVHASISGSSASSTSSTPEVKPLKSLLGDSAPALHLNKGTPSQSPVVGRSQGQQQEKKQFDLLSDLGSDIFAAPAPQSTATANFANFAHFNSHAGGSAGSVNANFAHFDNFPKSSSADFGTFNTSQSHQTASAVSKVSANKAGLQTTDKYAALANLDNIFSAGQGGDQGSGFGTTGKAPVGSVVSVPSQSSASSDKYAALAELDSVFSSAATSSNAYSSTSNASSNVFGTVPVGASAQTQPASSSVPAPFGATPSTNPFVAAAGPSVASSTNPFQTNARGATGLSGAMHSQVFPHAHFAATFGTASMSMPAGFGTPAPYSLPTSFSGSFQQPAFPAQAAFPQQTAFSQQPNGAGFAAFGQTKPVVTPFGQVAAAGVSSNPFMTGAPTGQFPTGSSSTNPFL